MGGGTPRALSTSCSTPAVPRQLPSNPSSRTPAPPPRAPLPSFPRSFPSFLHPSPVIPALLSRHSHAPLPSFLRRQEPTRAKRSITPVLTAGIPPIPPPPTPSPIHPSPLPGGRLGGGWDAASVLHQLFYAGRSPPAALHPHPALRPLPPSFPPPLRHSHTPPRHSCAPLPSFLRPSPVIPAQAGTHPRKEIHHTRARSGHPAELTPPHTLPQFIPPPFQGGG